MTSSAQQAQDRLMGVLPRTEFDVRYVLDDRNQVVAAWRSIGLPVLQVADGDF